VNRLEWVPDSLWDDGVRWELVSTECESGSKTVLGRVIGWPKQEERDLGVPRAQGAVFIDNGEDICAEDIHEAARRVERRCL
jgi:hypothetical protein